MRILFQRDAKKMTVVGTVEGRPEAVREFLDIDTTKAPADNDPLQAWIKELKEYLDEEVESITLA